MRHFSPVIALLILAVAAFAAEPAAPAGGKTVKLFTIGNSFSGNATHYLPNIVTAAGDKLIFRQAAIGGSAMDIHWAKVEKFEADPKDKAGLYSTGRSLRQDLEADQWDYVTIQQSSIKSHDLSTYQPFATNLRDYIKKYAPKAELLLHETWPYRVDDPRFSAKAPKPGEPATQADMYAGLSKAYRTVAKELGVRLIPVGDAFNLANTDAAWGYQPPAKVTGYVAPALPPQTHSLNKGYAWKADTTGQQKLGMDGHHANAAGEYLGGCVWFEVLFQQSVVGNSFHPSEVSAEDAAYLQKTAHRAVEDERARANAPGPG